MFICVHLWFQLQELIQLVGVEADDDLVADDQGGGHAAAVDFHQIFQRLVILGDVKLLELDAFGQEILSQYEAGGSGGLGIKQNPRLLHGLSL